MTSVDDLIGKKSKPKADKIEVQPKEVNISQALRMHSGYVRVKGGMISGARKLEKMPLDLFFVCENCGTVNEVQSYSRPRFAYEISRADYSKPRKCINCSNKIVEKKMVAISLVIKKYRIFLLSLRSLMSLRSPPQTVVTMLQMTLPRLTKEGRIHAVTVIR
jgi:hypothetical protein